jgi:hypothetical protein
VRKQLAQLVAVGSGTTGNLPEHFSQPTALSWATCAATSWPSVDTLA